jgi:hypothetical protein
LAVGIADRYLVALGEPSYLDLEKLAVTSVLLAAKLQEHVSPNFERMKTLIQEEFSI